MTGFFKGTAFAAVVAIVAAAANAQVVTVGTNSQGSLSYVAGAGLARVGTQNSDLTVRGQALSGSTNYLPMLARGEIDFGLSNGAEFNWAFHGTGNFEGRPHPELRYVGMLFPIYAGFAVVDDTGMTSLSDLAQHAGTDFRITSDYPSLRTIATYLETGIGALGLGWDDFVNVPVGGLSEGIEALGDGRADVTWIPLGAPAGRQIDAGLAGRGGWRFLDIDVEGAAEAYAEAFPGTHFAVIDDTNQPGVKEPVALQFLPYMIGASVDTPEETVYQMTKVLIEQQEALGEVAPPFRRTVLAEIAQPGGLPYHPGAIRAYEEAGMEVNMESVAN